MIHLCANHYGLNCKTFGFLLQTLCLLAFCFFFFYCCSLMVDTSAVTDHSTNRKTGRINCMSNSLCFSTHILTFPFRKGLARACSFFFSWSTYRQLAPTTNSSDKMQCVKAVKFTYSKNISMQSVLFWQLRVHQNKTMITKMQLDDVILMEWVKEECSCMR